MVVKSASPITVLTRNFSKKLVMNMKASCEFVLLSVLFAFSWGKDIQKTQLQPEIPKESVRIQSIDVPPAEPPALQVKMVIEPGGFSLQWPIQGGSARKGCFFPLSGILLKV